MQLINTEIPIYVSKVTYDILTKITPLLSKQNTQKLNLQIIEDDIDFGDIKVKMHNVNHSIVGACAYEIKTSDKTILYTGDLRFHGRTSYLSKKLSKIKNVDYLIMEGTTLGRTEQNVVTEQDLEEEFVKIFTNDKLPLVQLSTQNLDRIVTVYRACKKAGKIFVIDPYCAYILDIYSQVSDNIPQFSWDNIMVNFAQSDINNKLADSKILFKYKNKKIGLDEIIAKPQKYVIKGNGSINKQIFNSMEHDKLEIIFSMWKGYLDRRNQFDKYKDIKLTPLHTSGHAYIKDLQEFVNKLSPKTIIPVHTEFPEKYAQLYSADIKMLSDGEILEL